MKATGIVRKIDELGRIVIPKELRNVLGIAERDPVEIFTDDDGNIIMRKYVADDKMTQAVSSLKKAIEECSSSIPALSLGSLKYHADEIEKLIDQK